MPSSSEKFLNLLTLRYSVCSFNSVWLEKQPLWMHFPFFLFTFIPLSFASVLSNSMLKSRSFYHCMIKKRTASNKMELFLTLNKNSNVTTYPNTNQKKVANEKGRDCGWKSLCECLNSNKDSGVKRPVLFRSLFRSLSLRNHANCWHTQKKKCMLSAALWTALLWHAIFFVIFMRMKNEKKMWKGENVPSSCNTSAAIWYTLRNRQFSLGCGDPTCFP